MVRNAVAAPINWLSRRLTTMSVDRGAASYARLDGRWVHKNNQEVIEMIKGDMIRGEDGTVTKIIARDKETITIEFDGSTFMATLVGDQLFWDDGDIWLHRPVDATTPNAGAAGAAFGGCTVADASPGPSALAPLRREGPSGAFDGGAALPASGAGDGPALLAPAWCAASAVGPGDCAALPLLAPPRPVPEPGQGFTGDRERAAEALLGSERYQRLRHISEMGP